ncbi:hypothetical protein ATANTOWER_013287 [Ataeniobius toweri]|uniref:Uncharacterized protein n=1 Tax=Ataeniobius toweri TaxID=208326 RepID=A0ABU7CAI2_9TELE|nr:hypothetical protein [Ataeniobius toweri]
MPFCRRGQCDKLAPVSLREKRKEGEPSGKNTQDKPHIMHHTVSGSNSSRKSSHHIFTLSQSTLGFLNVIDTVEWPKKSHSCWKTLLSA